MPTRIMSRQFRTRAACRKIEPPHFRPSSGDDCEQIRLAFSAEETVNAGRVQGVTVSIRAFIDLRSCSSIVTRT
jgi:hypothetical protein